MNNNLTLGIIAVSALMLSLSVIMADQTFAKSVSECTNNGGQSSEGSCKGSDNNNKCQEDHAGNSFNSKVKSSDPDC